MAYSDKVVTDEQFRAMAGYASRRMSELVDEMTEGRISINPYEEHVIFANTAISADLMLLKEKNTA